MLIEPPALNEEGTAAVPISSGDVTSVLLPRIPAVDLDVQKEDSDERKAGCSEYRGDAANDAPPVLGGQLFNYVGAPNRLRLPAHYELHVWAWKRNSSGTFSDWKPRVSCTDFVQ
ncbi:MAG TPA: hypothetical protein VHK24_10420 [Steroidobacter sp.]|jgi:hypothetical protein|nr:hypothetical protein [Steroidobacter sp.]